MENSNYVTREELLMVVERISDRIDKAVDRAVDRAVERAIKVSVNEAERAANLKLLITLEPIIKNDEKYNRVYSLLKKVLAEN